MGGKSKYKTPTFLLTFEIFNYNVHNCLVESGASVNVMPWSVCKKMNGQIKPYTWQVIQLDRTAMKLIREMEDVIICLSVDERVCQYIDIVVADIPDAYGLVLSRDWAERLDGYFASNWSHLWFPYKGSPNQIKLLREPQMKYNVTQLEGKNELVNSVLENYFIELEPGNYQDEEASSIPDTQLDLLRFSWADEIDCNIVDLVSDVVCNLNSVEVDIFWTLYFDGSKTLEGSGAGCVLIDPRKNKCFLSCRLEFECRNNTVEYEALVQGLKNPNKTESEKYGSIWRL